MKHFFYLFYIRCHKICGFYSHWNDLSWFKSIQQQQSSSEYRFVGIFNCNCDRIASTSTQALQNVVKWKHTVKSSGNKSQHKLKLLGEKQREKQKIKKNVLRLVTFEKMKLNCNKLCRKVWSKHCFKFKQTLTSIWRCFEIDVNFLWLTSKSSCRRKSCRKNCIKIDFLSRQQHRSHSSFCWFFFVNSSCCFHCRRRRRPRL